MKFELLPNEILIDCFEYLNGPDIFHSFDQLNSRFRMLIRSIPLNFNGQHITKSIFDQFCIKILLNPTIKNQLFSLQLSNANDTCGQIQAFLSFFSFDDFCHLRSLTLVNVRENDIERIHSTLPLLSHLHYFCLTDFSCKSRKLLTALSVFRVRKLSVPILYGIIRSHETILVTHLTVSYLCFLDLICQLFKCAPMLKYLKIKELSENSNYVTNNNECLTNVSAICLTHLTAEMSFAKFDLLEKLLKNRTPNLKSFTLSTYNGRDMIDADRWEDLISSSLPHLDNFKFKFRVWYIDETGIALTINDILTKFQQFRTHFWHEQHHWYTECDIEDNSVVIYTIPYISHEYRLGAYTYNNCNMLIKNSKLFENVTHLTYFFDRITKDSHPCYFSNVKSLTLETGFISYDTFDYLKTIVNLLYLKDLKILWNCRIKLPLILLGILKEAPQLSSLTIRPDSLISLFNNHELCNYLNQRIRKLNFDKYHSNPCVDSCTIKQFCQVFSNVKQLECFIIRWDDLFFLISQLSKVSSITVGCCTEFTDDAKIKLQEIILKLNKNILFDYFEHEFYDYNVLYIWIGGNMT